MKRLQTILIAFIFFLAGVSALYSQVSKNEQCEKFVSELISKMTLEEKVGQLIQYSAGFDTGTQTFGPSEGSEELIRKGMIGSFLNIVGAEETKRLQKIAVEESRLKIPIIFGLDVIHGFKSTFPVPLAEACTWNPDLVEFSSRWQSIEATSAGIHWTFAPMVDIARDPRWGRIVEGNGEDTYLGSVMAVARVKGFQGDDLTKEDAMLACVKHYAAYGGAEGGRDYNTVDMSERTLREYFLPPYKAAIDAGAGSVMASFNEIGGVPSSASKFLMTQLLRDEWKTDAFVVSDWNSIGELVPHGVAADLKEAAKLGIEATIDMDMEGSAYFFHLVSLVNEGKVDIKFVDDAVRRVLTAKFILGLFDNPYKNCNPEREKKVVQCKEIIDATKKVADESIVLLKNENNVLPLNKDLKKIAIIGPLADNNFDPLGPWDQQGDTSIVVTVVDGLKNKLGKNNEVIYSKGCEIINESTEGFDEAVSVAKDADVIILCLGETLRIGGEAKSRATMNIPGVQELLAKEIDKLGKPTILVLMNSRPLEINWFQENVEGIIEAWFLGSQSGNAIADVLFGDVNPSGKLTVTFPRSVGQIPYYYNHKNTGRPYFGGTRGFFSMYLDIENSPLYPFGFGLSYSTFEYSNLTLNNKKITMDGSVQISVDVKNASNIAGQEVVQLYVRDLVGSVTRPVKELKGFKKIILQPGETKKVEFELDKSDLAFYDINMNYKAEPGEFKVFIGTNSQELLEDSFILENNN
ncbi:MAG: beta-glucosidase BglX [bacterium]